MRFRSLLCALALGAATLVGAADARAQASIGAGVTVLTSPVAGGGVRSIAFGTVPVGSTTTRLISTIADSTAAGIGHINFTGVNGNRPVQFTFDFPAVLTHTTASTTMPISFNGNHGLHCFNRNSGLHACTLFNPSPGGADPSVIVLTPPAAPRNGILRVYLGGNVTPPVTAAAGLYQGTITLTMVRL